MVDLSFLKKEKLHTGFGNTITDAKSYDDVLDQAGLNWEVVANPAYTYYNDKMIPVSGTKVIVRMQDEKALGIVSDKYKIVNNADAFAFTENLFKEDEIEFVRGGSYRGGSSTWLEAKVTSQFSILGDKTECYMIFKNSHDGTGSVMCMIVPERIACSNALNIPLSNASRQWRCTHSGDPLTKIAEAKAVLLAGSSYMEAVTREAEVLNSIKLSAVQINQFINRLFPINDDMTHKAQENRQLKREQLNMVFNHKDDLQNFDSNGYRFISAVADYADHCESRNTVNANINRYMSVVHGNHLVDEAVSMVMCA